eukprot:1199-Heterococcus_DN1.PRE.2
MNLQRHIRPAGTCAFVEESIIRNCIVNAASIAYFDLCLDFLFLSYIAGFVDAIMYDCIELEVPPLVYACEA